MHLLWNFQKKWGMVWVLAMLCVVAWLPISTHVKSAPTVMSQLVLLIPDSTSRQDPVTLAWLDAAKEEGLQIKTLTDNEFIQASASGTPFSGVILPDSVHARASTMLINTLHHFVEEGGQLLICFDAGLLDAQNGSYAAETSRLSNLTGVRYGMYASLQDKTLGSGTVRINRSGERNLAIQPGKLDFVDTQEEVWGELTTYGYPSLVYSYYRTQPLGKPSIWIQSKAQDTLLSINRYGRGQVLFANLPLGYLKTRTDSYLLHRVVSFFGSEMSQLPVLSSVPNGIGGMILNLHVDSNAAEKPLAELEASGWFDEGPYSIHVTAGPDAFEPGDRLGLNLPGNAFMQKFLQRQFAKGHEIGNHGGWNHNFFGLNVNEDNQIEFQNYLELNHHAISDAIHTSATAYSAPMGNQPLWVTDWLKANGFKGYYSTADSGLGPTQSYSIKKSESDHSLWTFPISNFRQIATLDELASHQVEEAEIRQFIVALMDYASDHHVARLFYFHPATANNFPITLMAMKSAASHLKGTGRFNWYTMAQLSDFLNTRNAVEWTVKNDPAQSTGVMRAHSATSLRTMTWLFPKKGVHDLTVTQGQARIQLQGDQWLVTAQDGDTLQLQWKTL